MTRGLDPQIAAILGPDSDLDQIERFIPLHPSVIESIRKDCAWTQVDIDNTPIELIYTRIDELRCYQRGSEIFQDYIENLQKRKRNEFNKILRNLQVYPR